MSEEQVEDEIPLSPWEQSAQETLQAADLPLWESKARAATFVQGHRGILDLDLKFPEEYLKGPAPECYVWKREEPNGLRIHAYADVEGNCFHLQWEEVGDSLAQKQPTHHAGACAQEECHACRAAQTIAALLP